MELRERLANLLIDIGHECFEEAYPLADTILSLPEIKEGEQLRRLCYLHDGPGGVSVQMREK